VKQLAATATITWQRTKDNNNMSRSNRNRLPSDAFDINDRVKCINPRSKHYGHTACVIGMGKARLLVEFENGHIGKFIDWRDATLISHGNNSNNVPSTSGHTTPTATSERGNDLSDIGQLTSLMEHMAFTSATVILSNYSDTQRMETLLDLFDRAVWDNARTIANTRQQADGGSPPFPPASS
jgi:hypothetical protein